MTGNLSRTGLGQVSVFGEVFGERRGSGLGDRAPSGFEHIAVGIDASELRALEQRVEDRRDLVRLAVERATREAYEQGVADGKRRAVN
jgi:hypothetical protein